MSWDRWGSECPGTGEGVSVLGEVRSEWKLVELALEIERL